MTMRYSLYPASFNGAALNLSQVASVAHRAGASPFLVRPGGSLDPAAHVLSSARPIASLMTHDLDTVLSLVSLTAGYDCSSASQLNFQLRTAGGAFTASNSTAHVTQSIEAGFLHITEISASSEGDEPAQCMLEFIALSADGDNPITDDDDAAINGQPTPAYNNVFFHAPAYLGATQLTGLIGTRVRPGIQHSARLADGGAFPRRTASSIVARTPVIELEFLNLARIKANITDMILAAFTSTLAVYFQQGTTDPGGRVAAGTGTHIMISAAAGSWGADNVNVQDTGDATFTATIRPTGVLSMSRTSAIPAA
jgi:hypothetical protein